ncbi:MAG: DNA-binding protein WhiA [Solobacterium sp.]|nr:DNA-binding protein WhiA [Solobacterium sp.]
MSYTSDIKTEISLKQLSNDETRAQLSALVLMLSSISITSDGMSLVIRTSNAPVSRAVYRMMKQLYEVQIETFVQRRMNLKKNLIYGFRIYGNIKEILTDLGLFSSRGLLEKPLQRIVAKDSCARAYLAGAFMADGSINSPETAGYHMEIRTADTAQAGFLVNLMERFYIQAKVIERRSRQIVYVKQAEKIADFIRCIGADRCLMEFEDARISRDFANSVTRLANVDMANDYKSLKAANAQLEDIRILQEAGLIEKLDEKLKDVVMLRLADPEASLNELAKLYQAKTGIVVSKSGLKHRFVKIHDLAVKAEGKTDE